MGGFGVIRADGRFASNGGGICDLAAPEGVVGEDVAAGADVGEDGFVVIDVVALVGIDEYHIIDVLQARLQNVYDMVFIDADKRHYINYYEAVLPHVRPGGYILADNTLWGGQVADPAAVAGKTSVSPDNAKSSQLRGILAFNDLVAADPRVETLILPLRDGLTILRKKEGT